MASFIVFVKKDRIAKNEVQGSITLEILCIGDSMCIKARVPV
jgi:hypothetical protein